MGRHLKELYESLRSDLHFLYALPLFEQYARRPVMRRLLARMDEIYWEVMQVYYENKQLVRDDLNKSIDNAEDIVKVILEAAHSILEEDVYFKMTYRNQQLWDEMRNMIDLIDRRNQLMNTTINEDQ